MLGRVQVGDVPTSYEEHGTGAPVVLTHPGHADARDWGQNAPALARQFRVLAPDRRGHGRTPDLEGPITQELMAADTAGFIEAVADGPVHLVGCSDGATVALLVALRRPDLVRRLVLCCGVFHHEGWLPGSIDLDEETTAWFADHYAEVSPDGREHFAVVKAKLDRMHREEPTLARSELAGIACPTLVMGGDRDEVTLEHLVDTYRGIPDARLAILPGTGHGVPAARAAWCNAMILDFLMEGEDR